MTSKKLKAKQLKLKAKQYEIANFDFMWCQCYLVAYIEMMTPPDSESEDIWRSAKSREFPDENFNFLDIFGRSLVTSIVISYIRPWSGNQRPDGSKVSLPERIIRDLAKVRRRDDARKRLLPFHRAVHKRVLTARNKVVAHSDFAKWGFAIRRAGRNTIETNLKDPLRYLSLEEARQLLENTKSLRSQLNSYKYEVRPRLRNTKA